MIKKLPLQLFLTGLVFFASLSTISAQASLREISLKEQINNSSLVVEGQVIAKKSFWDAEHRLIYTANTIEVYKVFKGEPAKHIEVLTKGGTVGLQSMVTSHSLTLSEDNVGVFTLYDSNVSLNSGKSINNKMFKPYSSIQGFYKYNLKHDVALNPFNRKSGVKTSFYNEIMKYTKSSFVEVKSFNISEEKLKLNKSGGSLVLGITDFNPTTATAGTATLLTINGSDFGSVQGKVGFANADSGGMSMGVPDYEDALDSQVVSWNDNQIIVEIPTIAGTGKIRVTHDNTSTIESATDLTIDYALINFDIDSNAWNTQHYSDNGSGGYTWEMFTDFFNETEPSIGTTGYKAAFMRAFDNWRCETKINWEISGSPTSVDAVGLNTATPPDEEFVNIIRFDNNSELDAGVLGQCTYFVTGIVCGTELELWINDIDIVFDDDTNWYFGSGSISGGQFDFETVALHELGHGHQLGHVIDPSNVMHFQLSSGTINTVLDANSLIAGNVIQARSASETNCGLGMSDLMVDYAGSCGLSIQENSLESSISIFPNPTRQQFFIKSTVVNLESVEVYDVSGRLISQIDTSDASRTIPVNLVGASKGVYFVNIHSEGRVITEKVIIQ